MFRRSVQALVLLFPPPVAVLLAPSFLHASSSSCLSSIASSSLTLAFSSSSSSAWLSMQRNKDPKQLKTPLTRNRYLRISFSNAFNVTTADVEEATTETPSGSDGGVTVDIDVELPSTLVFTNAQVNHDPSFKTRGTLVRQILAIFPHSDTFKLCMTDNTYEHFHMILLKNLYMSWLGRGRYITMDTTMTFKVIKLKVASD
jgi:hypothetical protein